jgi:sec-independent protein translocase protein TatC
MPEMPDHTNDPQEPRPELDPEHDGRLTPESTSGNLDPYAKEDGLAEEVTAVPAETTPVTAVTPAPVTAAAPPAPPAPPKSADPDEEDEEDDGMLRMSFLEHLEELRFRIIRALMGLGVAFGVCLFYTDKLWDAVREPAASALKQLGLPEDLAQITPIEGFSIIWVKIPVICALFIASPWILYQVWAFIAPGLYKKERKLATPFIFTTAGLFIAGGAFAYFVAFRFGLAFLLGIGVGHGVKPVVSITEYTDLFVNVILGVALVFELPVLIFFLTLLRIASPRFLLTHSRYAILIIVILAAVITPTPDAVNLTIFAAPMILLYFAGVFASHLLVLSREGRKFPWYRVVYGLLVLAAIIGGLLWLALTKYGYHWLWKWPFLMK